MPDRTGRYTYPVHELTVSEIHELHQAYAAAARRALLAGFEWLEMHFARLSRCELFLAARQQARRLSAGLTSRITGAVIFVTS